LLFRRRFRHEINVIGNDIDYLALEALPRVNGGNLGDETVNGINLAGGVIIIEPFELLLKPGVRLREYIERIRLAALLIRLRTHTDPPANMSMRRNPASIPSVPMNANAL
jgi:hypothetical protein